MIQSKHPPLGPIIDHASVPLEITFMVINVELVSPLNKQPELNPAGLIEGLETLPAVKSITLVAGLLGAIGNEGVVQPGTASEQSFGCEKAKPEQRMSNVKSNLFILYYCLSQPGKG
jgi:hypothetical protein